MVVPMLAPKTIVAACTSVMMPAFTKPITMTVVAPELWMAAVPSAPMPTPSSLLRDALANSVRSLSLPIDSRFSLIILQAMRKVPMPASRDNADAAGEKTSISGLLIRCLCGYGKGALRG